MDVLKPVNCIVTFDTRVSSRTGREYEAVLLSFPDHPHKEIIIGFGDLKRRILYALYVPDVEKEV